MARSKDLTVRITGDADKLDKEVRRSTNSLDKLGKQTRLTSSISSKGFAALKVGATGAAAGVAGLAIAGKKVVQAAIESEKAEAALAAQLKASGISYAAHAKEIDAVIQKHSQLAGVDDEELSAAFTTLVRSTGSVSQAMKDMGLVTDLARAKNIDVANAALMVAKVHAGGLKPLTQMGIEFVKTTANVDKLRASNDKVTPVQLAAAKAADLQANAQRALGLVQDRVRGQAEAYGKTTAGSVDRANVAFENLQETVGGAVAPTFEKAANKLAKFVNEMQSGTGQGGRFVDALKEVWQETKPIVQWIGRAGRNVAEFTAKHPDLLKLAGGVAAVGVAVKALRFASAATGFNLLLKGGRAIMKRLVAHFAAQGAAAGAAAGAGAAGAEGFTSAASFNKNRNAGRRVGRVAGRAFGIGIVAGFVAFLPDLVKKIDDSFIAAPFRFGGKVGKKLGNMLGTGAGDGIGKGKLGSSKGAGNLRGANRALAPFAAVGARFGLSVSSEGGLRPGATTSSGRQSYHSTGEALDMVGSPGGMMRTFRALKSSVGGRLAELIYTPGGAGIKNGRPHRYTGQVAADHYDHVHVAMDLGRPGPGIGDGYGKGQIKNLWTRAGGNPRVANLAAAVALAESGGESNAKNVNDNGSVDRGLWQINSIHGRLSTFDPMGNARAAVRISSGGRNWRPWVAYTNGAYRRFLGGGDGPSSSEPNREAIEKRIEANKDRIDALRTRLEKVPEGKAGASRRKSLQRQIRGITAANRKLGDVAEDAPTAEDRREAAERSGSRTVNRIIGRYGRGLSKLSRGARDLGAAIEAAGTGYGQKEREFGLTEEDLGTPEGRARRISELKALAVEKGKILKGQKARAALLQRAISKREGLIKRLRKARDRAKGAKRAKMSERIKPIIERQAEDKAELAALGFEIRDTELDIGDLVKEAGEAAGTPDTEVEPDTRAVDKVGVALGDIDLQERAGLITPEQANAQRVAMLEAALRGVGGPLTERQRWDLMGQLRDVTKAQTEAAEEAARVVSENTAAITELRKSIDAQLRFGEHVSAITSFEAVRAMADTMTGQLGARVVAAQRLPGSGALSRL